MNENDKELLKEIRDVLVEIKEKETYLKFCQELNKNNDCIWYKRIKR